MAASFARRRAPVRQHTNFSKGKPCFVNSQRGERPKARDGAQIIGGACHVLESDEIPVAPFRSPLVLKITLCFLAADASSPRRRSADQEHNRLSSSNAAPPPPAAPSRHFGRDDSAKPECRQVIVEIDEGYG